MGDPDHMTVILSKPEGQQEMEEEQQDERDRLRVVAAYDAAKIDRLTNDLRRTKAILMAIVHDRGVVRVHQDSIHHFDTIAAIPRLILHTDPATGDLMLSVQEK